MHVYTHTKNIDQHKHRPQSLKPDIIVSSELTPLVFNILDAPFHPLLQRNAKKETHVNLYRAKLDIDNWYNGALLK